MCVIINTRVILGDSLQGHAKQDSVSHTLLIRDQSKAVSLPRHILYDSIQPAPIYRHNNGLSLNIYCSVKVMHLI